MWEKPISTNNKKTSKNSPEASRKEELTKLSPSENEPLISREFSSIISQKL